jgi:eukaryotic-like serine/threonine-protein kinase
MQCLESATGKPRWSFQTTDHIEGGPVAADGTLFFPAGNDGLYAIDLEAGAPRWNFRADLHLDTSPILRNGRVYIGSGKSRRFNSYQVVCLDAKSGNPIWRTPVDLPAWGSPLLVGNRILVGLGNGRLNESVPPPERPAGALACFDIASGKNLWTFLTGDSVFGQPTVVGDHIVLGSRDGNLYAVSAEGLELFRVPMGGPVVASLTDSGGLVLAVSVAGRIVCLDPANGREIWRHELARTGVQPAVFAAPVVVGNRLYIAAEMTTGDKGIVTLFCFELPNRDGGAP